MFRLCTSLVNAPVLPATTLAPSCYQYMFEGCTRLNYVNVSFTDWNIYEDSTSGWLNFVSHTGTFECLKDLPIERGTHNIPEGWEILWLMVNKYNKDN
jgi:hypothetical protein